MNVSTIYQTSSQDEEAKKEAFKVGKLKKDIWNSEKAENSEENAAVESFKVGKIKKDFWNAAENSGSEQKVETEQVRLRGARRINKGNRISCLIENLHSDKKDDTDDEVNENSDGEEEVKIGKKISCGTRSNKDTRIKNIISRTKQTE